MKLIDLLNLCYDSRQLTIVAYLDNNTPMGEPYQYMDITGDNNYNDWTVIWWQIEENIFQVLLKKL